MSLQSWRFLTLLLPRLRSVKGRSTFCLEPGGDSPYRKSLWDSLAVGCIPVVFSKYSELTAPWHWGWPFVSGRGWGWDPILHCYKSL